MKTSFTHLNCFLVFLLGLLLTISTPVKAQVNGEIIADTNNLVVIKVWGTHYERGYAHGYLLGDKIRDILFGYLIPHFGSDYQYARTLVTNGQDLIIDSLYQVEAKAMIEGMSDAGFNISDMDYVDILVGSCVSDLYGYISKKSGGPGCSCLLDWGDATSGTMLAGKSIIARFADWGSIIPAIVNNAAMIIHIPSEPGLQPWLIVGYAGEMVPSGGGVNQGGLSMYKNAMSDYSGMAIPGSKYAPYHFTMRKILETDDFNGDGAHNTMDAIDGFNANSQGYPVGKIIPVIARWDPESDSNTAMVVEIAPTSPTHTYRFNSYEDKIPGDNLYAANSQIARNNARNYCARYNRISSHIGDGTNVSIQKNKELMTTQSYNGCNYVFIQHVPELDLLKVSVLRDSISACFLPMTSFDLRDFFNHPPEFDSEPETNAAEGDEYSYEIVASDPDPYDELEITTEQLPDWLTLEDHGDGTATLSGVPEEMGDETIVLVVSDGMEDEEQEFVITISETTLVNETGDLSLKIYPNPFRDKLFIETEEEAELSIFGISGNQLMHVQLKNSKKEISMSNHPPGIYFLKLQVGNEVVTKKVVKL